VFGTLGAPPPLAEYLGPEVTARVARVLAGRKPVVLGRFTQALPNNWKLYTENVRDSYHASLLHLFFTTFSEQEGYRLADPTLLEGFKEFDDGVTLQILSVFPGLVLQQIQNCLAVRQVLPRGLTQTDLHWTYLGYADDTPEQRTMRLKQANLVGAAGFVSMEDGAVGGFVQRGIVGADGGHAVVEMGGDSTGSSPSRVTESAVLMDL